jgi:hypothetical protein
LLAAGALATACVVGGFDVNPALDGAAGGAGAEAHGGASDGGKAAGGAPADVPGGAGVGNEGGAPESTVAGSPGASGSAPLGGDGFGGEAGAPNAPTCQGYQESDDLGNAAAAPQQAGTVEVTAQSLSTGVSICGQVDASHFAAQTGVVDVDSYSFVLPQAAEVFVSVEFAADLSARDIELVVSGTGVTNHRVRAAAKDASTWLELGAGNATVSVVTRSASSLAKPIHYVIRAVVDDLSARCARVSEADADRSYTEAKDGAANTGNDVLLPSLALEEQLPTASATDEAEAANLLPRAGQRVLISGSLASVDHGAGASYLDGDAYLVRPFGADQFTLRVDWAGSATANLDLWVFAADDFRAVAHATATNNTGPELMTIAVNRSTDYWVWVGAAKGSTGLPQAYDVTICGEALGL